MSDTYFRLGFVGEMPVDELVEAGPALQPSGDSNVTRGPVYRHKSVKDGFPITKHIDSLHNSFVAAVTRFPFRSCLGWRPGPSEAYHWLTYKETLRFIERTAGGLTALNVGPNDRVGVFAPNCKELMITL